MRRNSLSRSSMIVLAAALLLVMFAPLDGAEMRTWTASSGGYKVEAELIAIKPGDIAQLKTKDGRTIEVPLAQLTTADQDFARKKPAATATTTAITTTKPTTGSALTPLAAAQKAADRCRTPDEALILFKIFHDDETTSAADREAASARMAEYKQLMAEKKVRLNGQWVSADEAAAVRKKTDELMRQGLALWNIGQEEAFKKKFAEASAMEPDTIRAEFIQALIYTLARSAEKALPVFQRCLQRDPENVALLNNIAMLAAARGDWPTMLTHWRRALANQPDQRVVHNVGRFLLQSLDTNTPIPKAPRDALAGPYADLVGSGKFKESDPTIGWLFLLIEESDLDLSFPDDEGKKTEKKPVGPEATEDGKVVGGGTGFVVHPGYVLTNAHVAVDDASFEIQMPDGKLLKATRVAKATDADLALLKCEELTAPPLTLAAELAPRGTDVMLLGFPEMFNLGATLKATRGSISSIPDPQINNMYLYDAVTNSGNSGGPVCDDRGNVVAVHAAGINTASRYGSGVASTQARQFIQSNLPDAQATPASTAKLEWPAVDSKVSPSTVLIWVRKKNVTAEKAQIGSDVMELPLCLFCGGAKRLRCTAPGCAKGRGRINGVPCNVCTGKGLLDCRVCDGVGVDIKLASIQRLIEKAKAENPTSVASTTNSTPTSTPATSSAPSGTKSTRTPVTEQSLKRDRRGVVAGQLSSMSDGMCQYLQYDTGVAPNPTTKLSVDDLQRLLQELNSGNPDRANAAALTLSTSIVEPRAKQDIAMSLEAWTPFKQGNWKVRCNVFRAMILWNRKQSMPLVYKALRDPAWMVRRQASYTIAHSGDVSGIPALVDCLLRTDAIDGDKKDVHYDSERGRYLRCLIVMGSVVKPELQRVRPSQDAEGKMLIDYILAAIDNG